MSIFPKIFNSYKGKTIGILYICTGRYSIFWEKFYQSCENNFCPGLKKHYYVFTDQEIPNTGEAVTIIEQQKLGWPFDTLMRFHMFSRIKDLAIQCDYLFFFNANILFLRKVRAYQVLPNDEEKLVGVLHPFFYGGPEGAPYETNTLSKAFVQIDEPKHYVAGGFSGGRAADYLKMSEEIAHNIDIDQANGIIAIWHDESHINAYFAKYKKYKVLNPGYIVPEKRLKGFPFKPYMVVLDKVHVGGHEFLRG